MSSVRGPLTHRYYLAADMGLYCKGRPRLGSVIAPDLVTVRITRASANSTSVPVVVPPVAGATARNEAAGALPVGTASYPIPTTGTVRYVNPVSGSDGGTGVLGSPWKTVAYAITQNPDTIVLRGGVYHEGAVPGQAPGGTSNGLYFQKAGSIIQNYPGEAVWFDGSSVVTGWATDTVSVPGRTIWKKSAWPIPAFDRSPTAVRGAGDSNTSAGGSWIYIDPNFPIAMWGEQLFIDGVRQLQVATIGEVTTGTFFLEGASKGGAGADKNLFNVSTAYIGTNPAGKEIRASDLSCCFIINAAAGVVANITVRGIGVRRYCPALYDNAPIKMQAEGSLLENVWIEDISSTGVTASLRPNMTVRKVSALSCGFRGMHSHNADGVTYDQVRVNNADHRRFNPAPECGGIKITNTNGPTVKKSVVSGNFCHGVWADQSVGNTKVLSCDVQNNVNGHGVIIEISEDFVVADCLVTGNGKIGIYTQSTSGARLWMNTSAMNGSAGECNVDVFDDERDYNTASVGQDRRATAYSPMTWVITKYQQYNNVIGVLSGSVTYMFRTRSNSAAGWRTTAQMNALSDGNIWVRAGAVPSTPFMLARSGGGTGYTTYAQYRAAYPAMDINSVFVQSSNPLNADYSLTDAATATYSAVGRALPSDIAALIGKPVGSTHVGAWL